MIELKNKKVSVRRQCKLLGVHRSSLSYKKVGDLVEIEDLMKKIDEQYTKTPFDGSRRIAETFKAQGMCVNRKRIQRLMRRLEIQAIYRKPTTSKSRKGHKIYPYLLGSVTVNRADQAWASDIHPHEEGLSVFNSGHGLALPLRAVLAFM